MKQLRLKTMPMSISFYHGVYYREKPGKPGIFCGPGKTVISIFLMETREIRVLISLAHNLQFAYDAFLPLATQENSSIFSHESWNIEQLLGFSML